MISHIWITGGGVMLSELASSAINHGFESRSSQTKDSKIVRSIKEKSKDLLARNKDNVSEWGNMFIRELLLQ